MRHAAASVAACALTCAAATRVLGYNPGLMLDTAFVASRTGPWMVGALAALDEPGALLADGLFSGAALVELALLTPASAPCLDSGATAA